MKKIHKLINEPFAKSAAYFMKCICYVMILFFMVCLVLSIIGRQTFILHTSLKTYDDAIYAEDNHDWTSRGITVSMNDEIRVFAYNDEKIDLITQIGISAIYAVNVIPLIICFWFLSRVFNNVYQGRIFIEENAAYLLYYGLIQIAVSILVPFIKLLISHIVNQFTNNEISIMSQGLFIDAIPNIAFLVAAYIIRYGIHLQDEAEHTL